MIVRICKFSKLAVLPTYATDGSAGMDLYALLDRDQLVINPDAWAFVNTGIGVEIPEGFEGQIRPRSGLALKTGITVLNSPGTIDSDYRGAIGATLVNHGRAPVTIRPGDRIAQLVISPVVRATLCEVSELGSSARGMGGFGSTGK